jgi:uncharacterized membrane protein YfcA
MADLRTELAALLEDVRLGRVDPADAVERFAALPYRDVGFARVDTHREVRQGAPEAVLAEGKTSEQVAGIVSALLGVGGGTVKVPAMHLVMGVPLRVAVATSNLMIGVTASASAVLYLARGAVDPWLAGPVVLGVFAGASVASRAAHRVPVAVLRLLFVAVLGYVALEMAARALGLSLIGIS